MKATKSQLHKAKLRQKCECEFIEVRDKCNPEGQQILINECKFCQK